MGMDDLVVIDKVKTKKVIIDVMTDDKCIFD